MSSCMLCTMLVHPGRLICCDQSCEKLWFAMQAKACRASQLCWTWSTSPTG